MHIAYSRSTLSTQVTAYISLSKKSKNCKEAVGQILETSYKKI